MPRPVRSFVCRLAATAFPAAMLAAVGCLGLGQKSDPLDMEPETRQQLRSPVNGSTTAKSTAKKATPAPKFDAKQTGGEGVNVRDSFGRTTPRRNDDLKLPAPQLPQQPENDIVMASYDTKAAAPNPAPAPVVARTPIGLVPEAPSGSTTMPTPKLDLPGDPPARSTAESTGFGSKAPLPIAPAPTPTPIQTAPAGGPISLGEFGKPLPLPPGDEPRPVPPPPPSDAVPLPSSAFQKLPSATDGPIPGVKPVPLPPADPIRPN